jgi:hypothetical protein
MDVPLHDVNTLVLEGVASNGGTAGVDLFTEKLEIGKVDAG